MSKYAIVISEDALVYEDLELLKTLPNFSKIWNKTARVDRTRSCYPSLTYPAHTCMQTGCYPDRHGVVNNEQVIMCEKSSPWMLMREYVKTPTIFDYAKKAGLTTAAVFWPVTGNDPNIDYLVDEYWPQSPDEPLETCFKNAGSTPEVMEKIVKPNVKLLVNRTHPYCDEFINACACDIIRNFKPNLLMIHPANIDAYRHHTGVFTPAVNVGLYEIDLWLGDMIKACQDAGTYEDTDFFIISDHGQINITRVICPNVLLAENGLIDVDKDGNAVDYTAFCKSTGASTQVYLKNKDDAAAYQKTYKLLTHLCEEGVYGISRVYTAEEAEKEEHLGGNFSFVLETDGYTSFSNDWMRPLVRNHDISDYRFGRGTHGHMPDKGPQPTVVAFGPGIKAGAVVPRRPIVDIPLTVAASLGFTIPNADGKCITELLK